MSKDSYLIDEHKKLRNIVSLIELHQLTFPSLLVSSDPFQQIYLSALSHTHMILKSLKSLTKFPVSKQLLNYHLFVKLLSAQLKVEHQLAIATHAQLHLSLKSLVMHRTTSFHIH